MKKTLRRCRTCNGPRKGLICFKCGSETFEPAKGWTEPRLPSVKRIRTLAKEVGYAIGEHGSKLRDLDLIAAPWTEDAVDADKLAKHIADNMNARVFLGNEHNKPLGRKAFIIQIDGYYKQIDLSVCPRAEC